LVRDSNIFVKIEFLNVESNLEKTEKIFCDFQKILLTMDETEGTMKAVSMVHAVLEMFLRSNSFTNGQHILYRMSTIQQKSFIKQEVK